MDRFLNNNIVLRVIAVVIACILWLSINAPVGGPTPVQAANAKDFPYAVQVNLPSDMMVTDMNNQTAVVEITGSLLNSNSLLADMMGVQIVADARGLPPGKHVVPLKAVGIPPVQYTILPSSITVTIAKRITESKPIKVNILGKPASGFQAGTPNPDVQSVNVSGMNTAVDRVAAVTADISVANAKTTVSHTLTLRPVDKYGKSVPGVEVDPVSVTVVVPVTPPEVSVSLAPEAVGQPASGYAVAGLTAAPGSVSVGGTADATDNLKQLSLPVDVQGMRSTQTVQVPILLRSGWTAVTPNQVQVTVSIEPSASKVLSNIPLQVQNAPSGVPVKLGNVKTVTVRVTGPASVIGKLKMSDVVGYVDASGLTAGDTTAPVGVALPQWVQVSQLSVQQVPVTVGGGVPSGQPSEPAGNQTANSTTGGAAGGGTNVTSSQVANDANAAGVQ